MTVINTKVSLGEVLVFTQGEYSDFHIEGFLVAIKSFDLAEYARKVAERNRRSEKYDDKEGFAAFLIASEMAVPVAYREVHIGDYGTFHEDFGVPSKEEP